MRKIVRLIKYVNAGCVCITFDSVGNAAKYVHEHEWADYPYSNNKRKKIVARIKASIRDGRLYCGGQWQIQEQGDIKSEN